MAGGFSMERYDPHHRGGQKGGGRGGRGRSRRGSGVRGGFGRGSMVQMPRQPHYQQPSPSNYLKQPSKKLQPHSYPNHRHHPHLPQDYQHYHQLQQQHQLQHQLPLDPHNAYSNAWLVAMEEATVGLRSSYVTLTLYPVAPPRLTMGELEFATVYLTHLERLLYQIPLECWDYPPTKIPPEYSTFEPPTTTAPSKTKREAISTGFLPGASHSGSNKQGTQATTQSSPSPSSSSKFSSALEANAIMAVTPSPPSQRRRHVAVQPMMTTTPSPAACSTNRYASIATSDDDDDSSSDDDDDDADEDEDMKEAGDFPLLPLDLTAALQQGDAGVGGMDVRRLILRVLCGQSDLWAFLAMERAQNKQWKAGAQGYHFSCLKTRQAIELADREITRWWNQELQIQRRQQEEGHEISASIRKKKDQKKQQLMADADIVAVAIQHLIQQRDKYVAVAERQRDWLLHKLSPQWKTRDDVKHKWGQDRWTTNPNPKQDFAKKRKGHEKELRQIQQALDFLTEHVQSNSIEQLQATSQQWQSRFLRTTMTPQATAMGGATRGQSFVSHSKMSSTTSTTKSTSRTIRV